MLGTALLLGGCVQPAEPAPAVIREAAPPWDAPRDAISYIRLAGMPELPLDDRTDPWVVRLAISIDGQAVEIPAYVGIDRPRAVQAPVHTHDTSGEVWLEGQGNRQVSLADFFTVWGVRLSEDCLGNACGTLTVTVDGSAATDPPAELLLWGIKDVEVALTS
ncbi:hypothetical protein ACPCG0_02050 [Propionibacteriaceae bacterium Y1923]|uniref:hypothetical protein n=1 Tax=Aestuariimicrobium sp. Y1814 TaxID=3418742 RepID=UPI003C19589C